jgi:hypothetical protein
MSFGVKIENRPRLRDCRQIVSVVEPLLNVARWGWSDELIEKYLSFLLDTNTNLFLDKAEYLA